MAAFLNAIPTWFGLVSLAFCTAVLVFRLPFFLPSPASRLADADIFTVGIWRLFALGIVTIVLASCAELLLRTAQMTGQDPAQLFSLLPVVLMRSHYGTAWLVRIMCLLALLVSMPMTRKQHASFGLRYLMLLLALVVCFTNSAAGHPSADGDFTIKELTDTVHLTAACVWTGGVFVLQLVIFPSLVRHGDLDLLAAATRRFSQLAGYCVLLLIASGLYNARAYVGSFDGLWKTAYGLTLLVKLILFYFLLLLAAFNRFVSVPLLEQVAGARLRGPSVPARLLGGVFDHLRQYLSGPVTVLFRKMLVLEAVLMIAVLFCTSVLKHETPSSHLKRMQNQPGHRMPALNETVPERSSRASIISSPASPGTKASGACRKIKTLD